MSIKLCTIHVQQTTLNIFSNILALTNLKSLSDFISVSYEALGCFTERNPFAIPKLIKNFRGGMDWYDLAKYVRACAELVHSHGYLVFGMRYYGECWSGVDSGYDRYGPSESCADGVGKEWSHFVYRIKS